MTFMSNPSKPSATTPLMWFGNTLVTIRVASTTGSDGMCCIEHWMPYGESPPLHVHRNEDEMFHIISGTLRFEIGGRTSFAHAGDTVLAPMGISHSFRVESVDGAHVLTITSGSDFETMLKAASRPALVEDLPTEAQPDAETIARLGALCAQNGIDLVGPPLFA